MAGKSEKKLAARNAERKMHFLLGLLLTMGLHIGVVHYARPYNSTTEWVMSLFTIIMAVCAFGMMLGVTKFGGDLDMEGGVSDIAKDVAITADTILVLSTFSAYTYALWLWLVGLALWKLWGYLGPMMFPGAEGVPDAATKKKMDKRTRQSELAQRRAKGK